MTPEQKAAYVMAQAACAMAEIAGLQAENEARFVRGQLPMYRKDAFDAVIKNYRVGHNDVVTIFTGG